jgi:DNA-binding response OmpR family regulator
MASATLKVLLVDDNRSVLAVMKTMLEHNGFEVVSATNVTDALNQIVTQKFDALITDLHMPNAGDGFSVVTAMRHAQPQALTLVVSGFPNVEDAMAAIVLQADDIIVKPFDTKELAQRLRDKLAAVNRPSNAVKETVASILERDAKVTIGRWLGRVKQNAELASVPLADEDRTGHLPELTKEVVSRLRGNRLVEAIAGDSPAAVKHGKLRLRQGYTAPMMVQESRILQVCIFETIQRNLPTVDFSLVLPDVMLIADEVDSQLTQSVASFLLAQHQSAA